MGDLSSPALYWVVFRLGSKFVSLDDLDRILIIYDGLLMIYSAVFVPAGLLKDSSVTQIPSLAL